MHLKAVTLTLEEIDQYFKTHKELDDLCVYALLTDLRAASIHYFKKYPNRALCLRFLERIMEIRENEDWELGHGENIMLAMYLIGLHGEPEDALLLYETKIFDYDTFCGVDVQLIVFAGVSQTLKYLQSLKTEEGNKALRFLSECEAAGDFLEIEEYFSERLPWWV